MRALCPWDRGCWPFGISSGPIKKFSTLKVKGFLMFTLSSQRKAQKRLEMGRGTAVLGCFGSGRAFSVPFESLLLRC